jgi:non-heme chloroperoxidase
MAGRRVSLDTGIELYYVDEGAGRPVVFIPGWMANVEFFKYQLPHFSNNYRVISYDPRSQGASSRPGTGNNFTQRGKDLNAFIEALGLDQVVLVGWSYGSYEAYAYMRDFGADKVAGIVVIDQPPRSWAPAEDTESWSESPLRPDALLYFQRAAIDDRRGFWTYFVKLMLGQDPEAPGEDDEVRWMINAAMQMPDDAAALMLMDGTTSDFSAIAEETSANIPTLVYGATHVLEPARAWVREHMPKAEFAETPTHMGFYVDPTNFNARLERFLAAIS